MKRVSSHDCADGAKRHCPLSSESVLEIDHQRLQRNSLSTPPAPSLLQSARRPLRNCERSAEWENKARAIADWVSDSCLAYGSTESTSALPLDDVQTPDTMSDNSRLREKKRRSRSCSPTKKSPQYRNTVLKPANILVDVIHDLPPDVESLLPNSLRHLLSTTALNAPHAVPEESTNDEDNVWETELVARVNKLAGIYCEECRVLAGKPGSEPEYRLHLFGDVIEKLARLTRWRDILSENCSDKLWCRSLKPPSFRAALPRLILPDNAVIAKLPTALSFDSTSHDSNAVHVQDDACSANFTSPPLTSAPSEYSTFSDPDDTITTPKPDITIGISRAAFTPAQAALLHHWQANRICCSDPHATQGDMRFPFFFVEAKGLATNDNLLGAQNQAAGGGTCAVRLLDSLATQHFAINVPRIIFSLTTEGAIHELWVHYRLTGRDGSPQYHMTCLGAWRTTLARHAKEFVLALAAIFRWGVEVFYPQIGKALNEILESNR